MVMLRETSRKIKKKKKEKVKAQMKHWPCYNALRVLGRRSDRDLHMPAG